MSSMRTASTSAVKTGRESGIAGLYPTNKWLKLRGIVEKQAQDITDCMSGASVLGIHGAAVAVLGSFRSSPAWLYG